MSTIERLERAKRDVADGIDEAITTLKGSVEFRDAVEDLLKDTPHAKPSGGASDFEGLYGRLRNALRLSAPVELPREPSIVSERWEPVNVGHDVLYGKCPRCGCARIGEYCPPPCNTVSARWARGQRVCVPERLAEAAAPVVTQEGEEPCP